MPEPYYEDMQPKNGRPYYPFNCNLQRNIGSPQMCSAHWHYRIEILYATCGSARIFLNGQAYDFRQGDMVLISARDVHAVWGEPQTEYIVINFDPEILYTASHLVFESRYVLPFTMAKASPQKIFTSGEIGQTPLPGLIRAALQENLEKSYGYEMAVRTYICQIFLWVLRYWQARGLRIETGYSLKDQDLDRLRPVFEHLDRAFMQNLTAEEMSRLCNMSYSYFSRYFKTTIGMSFTAYLNYIRLVEAEKLLMASDRTVTEIAMDTGFSSVSYFISQFRKSRKVSPRQFRLKLDRLQDI